MALENMYILDLSSVHQIGKDLKCCLAEDYHERGMNLITAGCTGHICKAPFKKGSPAIQRGYLASLNRSFHRRKPSCCQSKDVVSAPHFLTPILIPGHPPSAHVSPPPAACHLLILQSFLPFTQMLTNSPTSINN